MTSSPAGDPSSSGIAVVGPATSASTRVMRLSGPRPSVRWMLLPMRSVRVSGAPEAARRGSIQLRDCGGRPSDVRFHAGDAAELPVAVGAVDADADAVGTGFAGPRGRPALLDSEVPVSAIDDIEAGLERVDAGGLQ